jgi:hypothetical protein
LPGGWGLTNAQKNALMAAGFGLMANRSPFLGQALGEAGITGMSAYQGTLKREEEQRRQQVKEKLEQSKADQQIARIKREDARFEETKRANRARESFQLESLHQGRLKPGYMWDPDNPGSQKAIHGGPEDLEQVRKLAEARKDLGAPTSLDPTALNGAAEQYLKTGTFPPRVGQGNTGAAVADRNAIMNRAYQLASERGIDTETLPKRWQQFRSQQTNITRFMSGPQGNSIRSLNVATDHLQTLLELGHALKNGNYPVFNELAARWGQMTGSAVPTNFDTAKQIIGTEVIKAIGVAGAGTKDERESMASRFSRASSPDQLEGAINDTIRPLLLGQLRGLRHQFMQSTGLDNAAFDDMLMPSARTWLGAEHGVAPATTAPPAARPPRMIYDNQGNLVPAP